MNQCDFEKHWETNKQTRIQSVREKNNNTASINHMTIGSIFDAKNRI